MTLFGYTRDLSTISEEPRQEMSVNAPRKRNAEATREAILHAAQKYFSLCGYDAAGLRDIAAEAGVNAALVNRYFGSKKTLFKEAIMPSITFHDLMEGDRSAFGQRTADYFCNKSHENDILDPMMAIIRSFGNPEVVELFNEIMQTTVLAELTDWLEGDHREQRAALIVSHLGGLDISRRLIGNEALSQKNANIVVPLLARNIQDLVDGHINV